MKIAFDAKRFFHNASGLGNYSRDLVRILSQYTEGSAFLLLAERPSERGKSLLKLPGVSFHPIKGTLARQLQMGKQAQRLGADLFHGLSGELPLRWDKTPIKKVVTIHDLIFMRYPKYYSFFDRWIHYYKFKAAAHSADRIVAISKATKDDIIKYLGVEEKKIKVIYQGCHEVFKKEWSSAQLQAVREKYSLPEQFILSVGTIEERKNLLTVVKALEGTGVSLVVVGKETKYKRKIEQFISKHKMQEQVHFLEGVGMEQLAVLYTLSTVFIYISRYEGFGIPLIEALFSGTAVITSNRSSLPEAAGPGALYVDPENLSDVRSKIRFLFDHPEERARLERMGREYVERYQDEVIAREMNALYLETLSE